MEINYDCKIKIINCEEGVNFIELENEDTDVSVLINNASIIKPYMSYLHNMTITIPMRVIAYNLKEMINRVNKRLLISYESFYGIKEVTPDEIIYIEAKDQYTQIVTVKEKNLSKKKLYEWDKLLHEISISFFRIHKSIIVNLKYIEKVFQYILFLSNGDKLKVSRRRKKAFKTAYNEFLNINKI